MNANDPFERMIAGYMAGEGSASVSDRGLDDALASTSRMRSYPRWLALMKEPPMRISSPVVVGSPTFRLASILALTLALILAAAGVVVAGASLLPSTPTLSPFGPAANGSLVYDKDGDIYIADADGSGPVAIVTGDTIDVSPWFSHDGRSIAFVRDPDGTPALMVADVDGSNVRKLLAGGDWNASFMPSDTAMVASRDLAGQRVLSMIDIGTGAVRDLDLGGLVPGYWQLPRPPDGREIIFTAEQSSGGAIKGLYAIAPDGTGLRAVGEISTTEYIDEDTGQTTHLSFQDPVLSSDGQKVAYWDWEIKAPETSTNQHLHERDLTTGQELPVHYRSPNVDYAKRPLLSPDGKLVVFESNKEPGGREQMFYQPVDGSTTATTIGPPFSYQEFEGIDFSPDGTKLIMALADRVVIINLVNGEGSTLADVPTMPSWQRLAR